MKKFISTVSIIVLIVSLVCCFFACSNGEKVINVSISEGEVVQTVEGFGSSSAWWSQVVGGDGNKENIAKMLYSEEGLNLNIYRYNIGAGSVDIKDKDTYGEKERMTESFLMGEKYTGNTHDELLAFVSNEDNYDFSKDKNAQLMLEECYSYGTIDNLILFANSPHYLMTINGLCRGTDGDDDIDNLAEENFDIFAKYLMVILKYFKVTKGYNVTYLSPINEPQWDWSTDKQEGCHYEPATMAKCLDVVNKELKRFNSENGTNVKLDVFESGNWNTKKTGNISRITTYLDEMKKYDYFEEVEHISFHSYSSPGSKKVREKFMQETKDYDIQVSISEYCQMSGGTNLEDFKAAQFLMCVMSYDFSVLKTDGWTWWISVSNYDYEDGLLYTNWYADELDSVKVSPRYYAMMHYSKFVKPGDKYVAVKADKKTCLSLIERNKTVYENSDAKMKCADDMYNVFKRDDGTVVIVYNNVTDSDYTWNIKDSFSNYEAYVSKDGSYLSKSQGEFSGSIKFDANSITTIILK